MKVRRLMSDSDLRDLPLDAFDLFLLARIAWAETEVDELPAPAPYERGDTVLRIDYLVRLGVLEVLGCPPNEKRHPRPVFEDTITRERPQLRRRQELTPLECAVLKKVSVANE